MNMFISSSLGKSRFSIIAVSQIPTKQEGFGDHVRSPKPSRTLCQAGVYLLRFHAAGSARAAAINLIISPIRKGTRPNVTAFAKLPSTTANQVTPQA
jgi:hypothetical protein